jgi:putative transposase
MSLYKNKYRIESARRPHWNYGMPGAYFITICVQPRRRIFGSCYNNQMYLNEIGRIADDFWKEIPLHFPHVCLDEFIIMPDHMHGIICIKHPPVETLPLGTSPLETLPLGTSSLETLPLGTSPLETLQCNVSKNEKMSEISPRPGSLSTIIRSYKSACTSAIRKRFPESGFKWQARFHDRVIRDQDELIRIRTYILNNPQKWSENSSRHHPPS